MPVRGVRGAITAVDNTSDSIFSATQELLRAILQANPTLEPGELASVFFTVTHDLDAAFPALAARGMGWDDVPMLCGIEIPVPGGLGRVVRVLMHWNTDLPQSAINHTYLRDAVQLRPDISSKGAPGATRA
jgi:chorismate mutase